MKDKGKWIIGIASVAATLGLVVFLTSKKKREKREYRSERIAEEGYETAGDVLFPISSRIRVHRPSLN